MLLLICIFVWVLILKKLTRLSVVQLHFHMEPVKQKKYWCFVTPDKEAEARAAGADFVGLDEFVTKIEGGWVDVDVIIATPSVMPKIGKLGKVLGPRNLMPNPKTGTVTNDVADAINEVKGGKIAFKVDKARYHSCFYRSCKFCS